MPKADENQPKKPPIDWESIEIAYRAGIRSLKNIGAEFGVSDAAIVKRAKRDEWERDLQAKIQAKAEAKVRAAQVRTEVSALTKVSEREVVEANATMQADLILAHRQDVQRYRRLCKSMLAQLEAETDNPELFEQIGELLADPDDKGTDKLNEAYRKAISLPQRIDGVKKLAETLKVLIGLERQAFGIADNAEGDKPKPQEEQNMPPRELARRIAFALSIGLKDAQSANPATPQQ
jgi:hypothetical protein